jgi:hypothetical protein
MDNGFASGNFKLTKGRGSPAVYGANAVPAGQSKSVRAHEPILSKSSALKKKICNKNRGTKRWQRGNESFNTTYIFGYCSSPANV